MNRVYVLIRADLSKSQRGVQAGHALLGLSRLVTIPPDETLVLLLVQSENELLGWREKTGDHYLFREPDIGDQATALATCEYNSGFDGLKLA